MKSPTEILKKKFVNKKRERVSLFDNQHKKRRFRPQLSAIENSTTTTTTTTIHPDIMTNNIKQEATSPLSMFSTTPLPHPLIPDSFPTFENISFAQLEAYGHKQPKHMSGFETQEHNNNIPHIVETANMKLNRQVIAGNKTPSNPLRRIATTKIPMKENDGNSNVGSVASKPITSDEPFIVFPTTTQDKHTTENVIKTLSVKAPDYDTRASTIAMNKLNSAEHNFVSNERVNIAEENYESEIDNEIDEYDSYSYDREQFSPLNHDRDNQEILINLDLGIEEVTSQPVVKRKVDNADIFKIVEDIPSENRVIERIDTEHDATEPLYKYEYKLIPNTQPVETSMVESKTGASNQVFSIQEHAHDGLYHPEHAPTYENLLQQDQQHFLDTGLHNNFGSRIEESAGSDDTYVSKVRRVEVEHVEEDDLRKLDSVANTEGLAIENNKKEEDRDLANSIFMKTKGPNTIVVKELKLPPSYYARTPHSQPFHNTIKQGYPISQYTPPALNSVETFLNNQPPLLTIRPPEYPPKFSKLSNYPVPVPRDYPKDMRPPKVPFTVFHQNSEGFTPLSYLHQTSHLETETSGKVINTISNPDDVKTESQFKRDANMTQLLKENSVPDILPRPPGIPNSDGKAKLHSSDHLKEIPRTPKFDVTPKVQRPPGTPAGFVENHVEINDLATEDSEQNPTAKHSYTVTTPASFVYFEQGVPAPGITKPPTKTLVQHPTSNQRQNNQIQTTQKPSTTRRNKLIKEPAFPNIQQGITNIGNKKKKSISKKENQILSQLANDPHYFPNNENYFPPRSTSKLPTTYPPQVNPYPTKVETFPNRVKPFPNKVPFQGHNNKVNKFKPFNQFNNKKQHRNKFQNLNHSPSPTRFPSHQLKPPTRRSQQKIKPNKKNKNAPKMNFHFVEDFSRAGPAKVKRFPQPAPTNTQPSVQGNKIAETDDDDDDDESILDVLKTHDLTVMAALLEETGLDKSIDSNGKKSFKRFLRVPEAGL